MTQEARVEPRRPRQVHEQNEVLAKRRHPVGSETEPGDAGGDRGERHRIDHERADHQQQLQGVEEIGRCLRVARGGGVEHQPNDQRQQQIEADQDLPLDVDGAARPRHRPQKRQ